MKTSIHWNDRCLLFAMAFSIKLTLLIQIYCIYFLGPLAGAFTVIISYRILLGVPMDFRGDALYYLMSRIFPVIVGTFLGYFAFEMAEVADENGDYDFPGYDRNPTLIHPAIIKKLGVGFVWFFFGYIPAAVIFEFWWLMFNHPSPIRWIANPMFIIAESVKNTKHEYLISNLVNYTPPTNYSFYPFV